MTLKVTVTVDPCNTGYQEFYTPNKGKDTNDNGLFCRLK